MAEGSARLQETKALAGMSLRALFLLNLWNDKTLQGPGFVWTLGSAGRSGRDAMPRHAVGFNTTPAMAPCVMGVVARMESDGAPPAEIARVRDSGAASLAAAGDPLFWGAVRPAAALAALVASGLGPVVSALVLVAAGWAPQAVFRLRGMAGGLRRGRSALTDCVCDARRALGIARISGSVVAGAFAGAVFTGSVDAYGAGGGLVCIAAVPLFGWLISSRGSSPSVICVMILVLSGVLSLVFGP